MKLYAAIDLHSNNNYLAIINEDDGIVFKRRLVNDLSVVLTMLKPYQDQITGIAVESTFNWYWLVDGLMEAGYPVLLVNTSAVQQYSGLKYTDDKSDALWLAHLMRLNLLPTGYIYPKQERSVRDLLRRRMQLVQHRTTHILSLQNQLTRNTGKQYSGQTIKTLTNETIADWISDDNIRLSLECNLAIMNSLGTQIKIIEKAIKNQLQWRPEFDALQTVDGIGLILAMTILLETGDIKRFKQVGHYASYCRCVNTKKISNEKVKGKGNRKNGNKFLSWAFIEASHYMMRYNSKAKAYYQKKAAKTMPVIARKALAHKLARACYYIIRDQIPFDDKLLFG